MANQITKSRYWVGVLYPENMVEDWQESLYDTLQLPFAYCIHDKDTLEELEDRRKKHIHLILVFPNTTTYKHALSVFSCLSRDGVSCINTCESVINIKHMYNYLIHDTAGCRKKNKYLYDPSERITGNNFDIGAYEQLSAHEKNDICKELCTVIKEYGFYNFMDFFDYVISEYEDPNYFEILKINSGFFERLTKANFQRRKGD